jgi:hypothetical protein
MSMLQIRCWKTKKFYTIDTDALPIEVYKEAVILGLRDLLNRGMSFCVEVAATKDFEAIAQSNIRKIMRGEIRYSKLPSKSSF